MLKYKKKNKQLKSRINLIIFILIIKKTIEEKSNLLSKFESVKIYWLSVKFDWLK